MIFYKKICEAQSGSLGDIGMNMYIMKQSKHKIGYSKNISRFIESATLKIIYK